MIQKQLEKLTEGRLTRERTNLQLLWDNFKTDIQKIVKTHMDKAHYKLAQMIKNLEKDIKALVAKPDSTPMIS